ncbi:hypothetical protein [Glaciecola sp. 1036]|uniref:hypothetical protein n=1 Tax=Alteromonadaceae TaxID=72275 RepID=UPI003CFBC50B
MKHLVDIHVHLSTPEDMEDRHDDPYEASECLNSILHLTYDKADDDIDPHTLEQRLQNVWEVWHLNTEIVNIDIEDLVDWVDHQSNT